MNLKSVLTSALNERALMGFGFGRDALDADVIELFEANGVDIDSVVAAVEANDDGRFDV